MSMREIVVTDCCSCPFLDGECFNCNHPGLGDDVPRRVTSKQAMAKDPPAWCPLANGGAVIVAHAKGVV